jgi:hypothetical protein
MSPVGFRDRVAKSRDFHETIRATSELQQREHGPVMWQLVRP